MNEHAVICQVRYTLDLNQLSAFKTYARAWIVVRFPAASLVNQRTAAAIPIPDRQR